MEKRGRTAANPRLPIAGSHAPHLIVCERSGRWAVALRRELGEVECRLEETRVLADCWDRLAEHPASIVVLELSAGNAAALVDGLGRCERQFPGARVAVVAVGELQPYEWLVREAGAVHFVTSPRQLGPLAAVARRHWSQTPEPRRSLAERIWAGLPWGHNRGSSQAASDGQDGLAEQP